VQVLDFQQSLVGQNELIEYCLETGGWSIWDITLALGCELLTQGRQ
jgi:hypothetical protein